MRKNVVGLILAAAFAAPALAESRGDATSPERAAALAEAVHEYCAVLDESSPWEISGALGAGYQTGNSETLTVAIGFDAKRNWDPWTLGLKLGWLYGRADGVENSNEVILIQRLERKLDEKSSIFEQLLLEHDEREELNYRIQLTLGYRRNLVKKEKFELNGEAGLGVLYEKFHAVDDTKLIAHVGVDWKWLITDKLTYTQIITIYPELASDGGVRVYWESVFTAPVSEQVDFRLAFIDRYDSEPVAGVQENDFTVTLGIQVRLNKKKPAA